MGYGITGWKFGGRQSITQNLYPGQFRGMGKPHYRSSVFVQQNNYYGNMGMGMMYDNHCCGCNDGGGSNKFMNWMFGLGMFGNMLSGILGALGFGGGGSTETTNTTNTTNTTTTTNTTDPKDKDDFAGLKTLYPDGNFAKVGDKYCCNLNGVPYDADSLEGLYEKLKGAGNKPADVAKPKVEDPAVDPNKNKVDSDPAAEDPANSNPADKPKPDGGAGNSRGATGSGNRAAGNTGIGNEEWYRRDTDKSSIEGAISKQKIQAADTTPKGAALYIAKTVAAEKNRNLTPEQLNKLADAIIAKNPSVFDKQTGKLLPNAKFDKLDIPNVKTLDSNYGAKKASSQSAPAPSQQKLADDIAANMFKAIDGTGTDTKAMDKEFFGKGRLTPENAVKVCNSYKKKSGGENLYKAIANEWNLDNKDGKGAYINKMMTQLKARAMQTVPQGPERTQILARIDKFLENKSYTSTNYIHSKNLVSEFDNIVATLNKYEK